MNEETNTLVAKWYLAAYLHRGISPRDFSNWAISLLEQGFDSKNLRILASMFNADMYEVEDFFHRTLKDLRWTLPSKEECIKRYVDLLVSKIADGTLKPFEGCIELKDIYYAMDQPRNLSNWHALYWSREDVSREELDKIIIEDAQNIMAGNPSAYIDKTLEELGFVKAEQKKGMFAKLWQKLF